ncbi:MAG: hypothetical protein ACPGUZ_03840 [Holosporaceae bacterium]
MARSHTNYLSNTLKDRTQSRRKQAHFLASAFFAPVCFFIFGSWMDMGGTLWGVSDRDPASNVVTVAAAETEITEVTESTPAVLPDIEDLGDSAAAITSTAAPKLKKLDTAPILTITADDATAPSAPLGTEDETAKTPSDPAVTCDEETCAVPESQGQDFEQVLDILLSSLNNSLTRLHDVLLCGIFGGEAHEVRNAKGEAIAYVVTNGKRYQMQGKLSIEGIAAHIQCLKAASEKAPDPFGTITLEDVDKAPSTEEPCAEETPLDKPEESAEEKVSEEAVVEEEPAVQETEPVEAAPVVATATEASTESESTPAK